ncbi:TetR/AcrR family transcriptional regulator, partial [bacterium]
DLTTAMGINRPSLYAAFGNKEALFKKVVESYCSSSRGWERKFIESPSAREAIAHMLLFGAAAVDSEWPQGCLLVKGALACSEESSAVQAELSNRRADTEALLRRRLERAKLEGELPPESDPADLARYFATVMQGFSVQAVGGASAEELKRVAEMAMRVWPE